MKRYYFVGFILLLAFLLFIFAGTAGSESEVVLGTVGFLGIVAILPLFLYLVFIDPRLHPEEIQEQVLDLGEQEAPLEPSGEVGYPYSEALVKRVPKRADKLPKPMMEKGVDKDFIEGIRAEKVDKTGMAAEESESAKEIHEQLDLGLGTEKALAQEEDKKETDSEDELKNSKNKDKIKDPLEEPETQDKGPE